MAIMAEEQLFKLSIAMALQLPIEQLSDETVQDLISQPTLPKELKKWVPQGLPPLGDRRVLWRWLGPVFEDSPLDLQQKSIVVRNLEEVGVETSSALKFLFPERTESEIRQMLTGFPFREANQSAMALSQQISSLTVLMTTPDPRTGQPIGMQMNNLPIIESILNHILKRLNYGISNEPASTPGSWSSTPGGNELSAAPTPASTLQPASTSVLSTGQPIPGTYGAVSSAAAAGLAVPAVNGYSSFGSPAVSPAYGSGPVPDFASPLPVPGGTSRTSPAPNLSGVSALGSLAQPIPGIPADLSQYPAILQSVWGNTSGSSDRQRDNVSGSSGDTGTNSKRRNRRK
jgi:hypothetical protein